MNVKKFVMGDGPQVLSPLPLKGFPEGKTRIRIRPHTWVSVFVVNKGAAHHFTVVEQDGFWTPGPELARNTTVEPTYRNPRWDSGDHWADHPAYPINDWQREVSEGNTRLGYHEWVASEMESQASEHEPETTPA